MFNLSYLTFHDPPTALLALNANPLAEVSVGGIRKSCNAAMMSGNADHLSAMWLKKIAAQTKANLLVDMPHWMIQTGLKALIISSYVL